MPHTSRLTRRGWGFSLFGGWLSIGAVGLVAFLLLVNNSPFLSAKLEPWIPGPVARLLHPPPAKPDTVTGEHITSGSTKHQVLRIQGVPTSMSDHIWKYGKSEIYFKSDRVVGWNISPTDPLKAR